MYTIDDFDILYYSIAKNDDIGVDSLNEIDFKYADRIYLGSVEDGRWQEDLESIFQIWFFGLLSDSPKIELRINYSGVTNCYSYEIFPFNGDVENSIHQLLKRINTIFDKELLTFYDSAEWLDSPVFKVLSKLDDSYSIEEDSQIYMELADVVESGYLDFKLDPSFRRQLTKHITLKPDKEIQIDVDAFIHKRILKYKG